MNDVDTIEQNIREQLPAEQQPRELAHSLTHIAELWNVPLQDLSQWLQFTREGKEFTAAGFSRWARSYAELRAQLAPHIAMCPNCGHPAEQIGSLTICECPDPQRQIDR